MHTPSTRREEFAAIRRLTNHVAARLALATLGALAACRPDAPTGAGGDARQAPVTVQAALTGTAIQALTIIVSGPGIATPIVTNVDASADVATVSTTISVPVGGQRTFTARGFDATGTLTHEGMATVTVRPTANAPVAIRMYPRTGDVPVTVGVGTYAIAIAPSPLGPLAPQATQQLTATVTDADGAVVPGAVVAWGSLNPVVASVSPAGLVTARVPGTTTLFATYQGTATSVDLTVTGTGAALAFRDISAGAFSTCGVALDGLAYCWGVNAFGQLGDGTTTDRAVPAPVSGGLHFASISTGFSFACGVTTTGEGWCWGFNTNGTLGDGTQDNSAVPRRVAGDHTWRSITTGMASSCGITTTGETYCWGLGIPGTLGLIGPTSADYVANSQPVAVTSRVGPWTTLSIVLSAACGVTASGAATCEDGPVTQVDLPSISGVEWLDIRVGQLTWLPPPEPNPFGNDHGTWACGLTTSHEVRCWGDGVFGELGGGPALAPRTLPTAVEGAQGWDAVAVGGNFACALRGGLASCWGRNDYGQLGDGTRTDRSVPTAVSTPHAWTRISAGFTHACAIRADGAAFCWGANTRGEVGDGTTDVRDQPVPVNVSPAGGTP